MSVQDTAIVVILGVCVLYGMYRGLIRVVFALLSAVLGGVGAVYLHGWVGRWFGGGTLANVAGFVLCFFVIALVVGWVGRTLWRASRAALLSWLDRLLGGLLGLAVGCILTAVGLGLLTTYVPGARSGIGKAKVAQLLLKGVNKGKKLLPKKLEERFKEGYDKVLEKGRTMEKGTRRKIER
ncbi:MAG TPA: CvpA family protein [Candidatus Latescibacteria bacterium]|nr:CvpA family protein [Candidatus Latescibacterota bacterium]